MMKPFTALCCVCLLCACAGAPPAWWNPSGAYGAPGPRTQAAPASLPASVTPEEEEPAPLEQSIEPAMESYEEMNLPPLSESDETRERTLQEENTVPSSPAAAADASGPLAGAPTPAQTPAAEPERLPQDGSLPAPSVLD